MSRVRRRVIRAGEAAPLQAPAPEAAPAGDDQVRLYGVDLGEFVQVESVYVPAARARGSVFGPSQSTTTVVVRCRRRGMSPVEQGDFAPLRGRHVILMLADGLTELTGGTQP